MALIMTLLIALLLCQSSAQELGIELDEDNDFLRPYVEMAIGRLRASLAFGQLLNVSLVDEEPGGSKQEFDAIASVVDYEGEGASRRFAPAVAVRTADDDADAFNVQVDSLGVAQTVNKLLMRNGWHHVAVIQVGSEQAQAVHWDCASTVSAIQTEAELHNDTYSFVLSDYTLIDSDPTEAFESTLKQASFEANVFVICAVDSESERRLIAAADSLKMTSSDRHAFVSLGGASWEQLYDERQASSMYDHRKVTVVQPRDENVDAHVSFLRSTKNGTNSRMTTRLLWNDTDAIALFYDAMVQYASAQNLAAESPVSETAGDEIRKYLTRKYNGAWGNSYLDEEGRVLIPWSVFLPGNDDTTESAYYDPWHDKLVCGDKFNGVAPVRDWPICGWNVTLCLAEKEFILLFGLIVLLVLIAMLLMVCSSWFCNSKPLLSKSFYSKDTEYVKFM